MFLVFDILLNSSQTSSFWLKITTFIYIFLLNFITWIITWLYFLLWTNKQKILFFLSQEFVSMQPRIENAKLYEEAHAGLIQ